MIANFLFSSQQLAKDHLGIEGDAGSTIEEDSVAPHQ